MSQPVQRPTYSLFWDFFLIAMALSAWLFVAASFKILLREAGGIGWNLIAMWPLGAAFFPLFLIVLIDFTTRIRHRTATIAVVLVSLLGLVAMLSILHIPGFRDSAVLSDLRRGGSSGLAYRYVSMHLDDDPVIGKEVLRDASLSARLEKEMEPSFSMPTAEGTWAKQMTQAAWRTAGRKARRGPIADDFTRPSERRVVLALFGVEARPAPELAWLKTVVTPAPTGSFRLGLTSPAEAANLAERIAQSVDLSPDELASLVFAATQHPGLLGEASFDSVLTRHTQNLVSQGVGAQFPQAMALRQELRTRFGGADAIPVAVVADSALSMSTLSSLKYAAVESVHGLFASASVVTTRSAQAPNQVQVSMRRSVVATEYQDTLLLSFGLGESPMPITGSGYAPTPAASASASASAATDPTAAPSTGAKPDATPPATLGPYLSPAQVVEIPFVLPPASQKASWLFGVPLFYLDVAPRKLRAGGT